MNMEYMKYCEQCGHYYSGAHGCSAIVEAPHGISAGYIYLSKYERELLVSLLRTELDGLPVNDINILISKLERGE